jgi:hypothetical protein
MYLWCGHGTQPRLDSRWGGSAPPAPGQDWCRPHTATCLSAGELQPGCNNRQGHVDTDSTRPGNVALRLVVRLAEQPRGPQRCKRPPPISVDLPGPQPMVSQTTGAHRPLGRWDRGQQFLPPVDPGPPTVPKICGVGPCSAECEVVVRHLPAQGRDWTMATATGEPSSELSGCPSRVNNVPLARLGLQQGWGRLTGSLQAAGARRLRDWVRLALVDLKTPSTSKVLLSLGSPSQPVTPGTDPRSLPLLRPAVHKPGHLGDEGRGALEAIPGPVLFLDHEGLRGDYRAAQT